MRISQGTEFNNIPDVCIPHDHSWEEQRTMRLIHSLHANDISWHLFEYHSKYEPNSCVIYLHFSWENITSYVWCIYTSNISLSSQSVLFLLVFEFSCDPTPICSYLWFYLLSDPFTLHVSFTLLFLNSYLSNRHDHHNNHNLKIKPQDTIHYNWIEWTQGCRITELECFR